MAILVGMLDKEFQDAIWERGAFSEDMTYEQVKSYVTSLASKRIQRITPKVDHGGRAPMDTSQVSKETTSGKGWGDWGPPGLDQVGDQQGGGGGEEYDENAVHKGKSKGKGKGKGCYNCNEPGHFQRNCPYPPKGKGKGKGKAKGGKGDQRGKGGPFQGAWNYKPTGYGYQGICHNCGEVGHKKFECKKPRRINELEDVQAQPQQNDTLELGRIWNLGMVEVSKNPFAVLQEEEEEELPDLVDSDSGGGK